MGEVTAIAIARPLAIEALTVDAGAPEVSTVPALLVPTLAVLTLAVLTLTVLALTVWALAVLAPAVLAPAFRPPPLALALALAPARARTLALSVHSALAEVLLPLQAAAALAATFAGVALEVRVGHATADLANVGRSALGAAAILGRRGDRRDQAAQRRRGQ